MAKRRWLFLCVQMDKDADAERNGTLDVELARAQQRNVADADASSRCCGKLRSDVVGRRKDEGNQVLMADAIPLEDRADESGRPFHHLLSGVSLEGGSPPKRS